MRNPDCPEVDEQARWDARFERQDPEMYDPYGDDCQREYAHTWDLETAARRRRRQIAQEQEQEPPTTLDPENMTEEEYLDYLESSGVTDDCPYCGYPNDYNPEDDLESVEPEEPVGD